MVNFFQHGHILLVTMSSSSTRPLAQQLLRTRGQGIAAFVQEHVHSTAIGAEATAAFVQQLLTELEASTSIFSGTEDVGVSDEDEIEIGTLISASSLTIRYVTEREAMAPVVTRFGAVFRRVLRCQQWTKAMLGLKMVSLMGATRILESFGSHVTDEQVLDDLRFLVALFAADDDRQQFVMRANYLFRPSAEHLTVAIQSHPSVHSMVATEIVPSLIVLVSKMDEQVSDAVATELLATIAAVLDLRYPSPNTTAFTRMPMPSFAVEDEDAADDNIHLPVSEEEGDRQELCFTLPSDTVLGQFSVAVMGWMGKAGRRRGVVANLPHILSALESSNRTDVTTALFTAVLDSIHSADLARVGDFEFFQAAIEALRDLGRRDAVPLGLDRRIFDEIKDVMPRLQHALKALDVDVSEVKAIKALCSSTREVLVELVVWWMHTSTSSLTSDESVGPLLGKLADPRVYGDLLFVKRRSSTHDEAFAAAVDAAVAPLLRAVAQLDRYAKATADRILSGVARVAIGAGISISTYVDAMAAPITASLSTGHRKGKSRKQRITAVACVLVACLDDAQTVKINGHGWVLELVNCLVDDSASLNVHSLEVLEYLVRESIEVRQLVAHVCATTSLEVVGHLIHTSLAAWPIFAEDLDAVLLVLRVLGSLMHEEELLAVVDTTATSAVLNRLMVNAQEDDQLDLVEACADVLRVVAQG